MNVEEKGKSAVAWLKGTKHKFYEDRYRLLCDPIPLVIKQNRGEIFAVFDGIGSAPLGMRAAQEMCDCLIDFYRHPEKYSQGFLAIRDILMEGNQNIHSWGVMPGTDRPMGGCAGTVVWLVGDRVYVLHAGDTVALLIRDGRARQLTRLHEISGGIFYYFGLGENLKIDVDEYQIEEGDRIIVMSDGVSKVFSPDEIRDIVDKYYEKKIAVRELVQLARSNGSSDDITAVIIDVEEIGE